MPPSRKIVAALLVLGVGFPAVLGDNLHALLSPVEISHRRAEADDNSSVVGTRATHCGCHCSSVSPLSSADGISGGHSIHDCAICKFLGLAKQTVPLGSMASTGQPLAGQLVQHFPSLRIDQFFLPISARGPPAQQRLQLGHRTVLGQRS